MFFVLGFIKGLFSDSLEFIFSIISFVIEIPLTFGFTIALMKLYNDEEVKSFDFLSLGFSNFAKSWKISLHIILKMIIPVVLLVVSIILISGGTASMMAITLYSSQSSGSFGFILAIIGFILYIVAIIWTITKSYYYQLAYFVAIYNADITAKESVEKSAELMTNKRGKLFCLQLSFIGWAILASITFGIGYLWLSPYILFATIAFYKFATGNNLNAEAEVVTENNDPVKEI